MHRDLELAAAGLVDVGGELRERFGVEIGGRVGGGQVPFGLGKSVGAQGEGGGCQGDLEFHERLQDKEIDKS